MDLNAWQAKLREFADQRGWQPFHTPKNLATALMVEAAELAEIFQWMTPGESALASDDVEIRARIGDEVADVLLYLLQVADHTGIDIESAVERKFLKNAEKHPATHPAPAVAAAAAPDQAAAENAGVDAAERTSSPSETHVLIDWENVQPKDADVRKLVPDATDLWIFHGRHQKYAIESCHPSFGAKRATAIEITRPGKNALDFHLSFYMGYIAARHPQARFVVLSNDQGYAPMVAHAKDLRFSASVIGFQKASPGAKGVKLAPSSSIGGKTQALDEAFARVEANLRKTSQRPAKLSRLAAAIDSWLKCPEDDAETVPAVLSGLLAGGCVAIDAQGHVEYAL